MQGCRIIPSKYPPVSLFEDVASIDEFEAVFAVQALTNPRLQTEMGDLNLIPRDEIPFGIPGCSYAIAPFTHVNPDGSRFSAGDYGVLYLADEMDTAIAETSYHQTCYFKQVEGLHFDVITMRGLQFTFTSALHDITQASDGIYHPTDYSQSRQFGRRAREEGIEALQYRSVRRKGHECYALFTPKNVKAAIQTTHFDYVWDRERIQVKMYCSA